MEKKTQIQKSNLLHLVESKLEELKQNGSYRQFINIQKSTTNFPEFQFIDKRGNTKNAVNWCTNDYLALSIHPHVIQAASAIIQSQGVGSGGTRNISGSTAAHLSLENTIAAWHKKEAALLFNSAYQANLTTLATLGRNIPDLIFISDEENHASIIEGIRGHNKKYIFRHNDVYHLEEILKSIPSEIPKIIVFESVYSISGTLAPIQQIVRLANKYHCHTYIDEVHGVGLYGPYGAGKVEELGLETEIDFINGTLSKAIGCFGGYISASAKWIDFIRSFASGFIFTTSLPPSICIAAKSSIETIINRAEIREKFFKNVEFLRRSLNEKNIQYTGKETHITQIVLGNAVTCKQIADYLLNQAGIYTQPINFPTVPKGQECLRITITPKHSFDQIHKLVFHLGGVLTDSISIIGRASMLSKAQLNLSNEIIKKKFPWIKVVIKYTDTRGDDLQDVPLHTQEGSDFFTDRVSQSLGAHEADIAVHSLKDLSNEHFFGKNKFAVIDRDEVRDIAIFNEDITDKLKKGIILKIGTCSFRRETLAIPFLKEVLPGFGNEILLESAPIRGNIDTRLQKLSNKEYDGIILAFAGINRMLKTNEYKDLFQDLLKNKKIMVLPLFECTPAPAQGAIAVECLVSNPTASYILDQINDSFLFETCASEKKLAGKYGAGCIQKFGISFVKTNDHISYYAHGIDQHENSIDEWYPTQEIKNTIHPDNILHSDDLGFIAERINLRSSAYIKTSAVFVSHISSIDKGMEAQIQSKIIWAAGTATWKKLAAKNIWVQGCADSLGFENSISLLQTPLLNLKDDISILTNEESAKRWESEKYPAFSTYAIHYKSELIDRYKIKCAQLLFWSCFAHFDLIKDILPDDLIHACLPGKTSELLKQHGIRPILFPTIKSFYQWKKKYSQVHSAA